jgi:hypothetical protein
MSITTFNIGSESESLNNDARIFNKTEKKIAATVDHNIAKKQPTYIGLSLFHFSPLFFFYQIHDHTNQHPYPLITSSLAASDCVWLNSSSTNMVVVLVMVLAGCLSTSASW